MRFKTGLVVTAAALATLLTPLIASPAAAGNLVSDESISTNAYYGRMAWQWRINPYRLDPIAVIAEDRATDGYRIGIRLVTGGELGKKTWSMRIVPTGQTHAEWQTYLEAGWIDYAYFQVCKINASSGAVASCHDSKVMQNPFDDSSV
ncbi:hypothetical protein [Streptomyces sp. NPDC002104]